MKFAFAAVLLAGTVGAGSALVVGGAGLSPSSIKNPALSANAVAKIIVDYPLDGSVFPPEITPPTFLWRDTNESAKHWVVEVSFAGRPQTMRVEASGEHFQLGEIDPKAVSDAPLPQLTPEQEAMRTWKPDDETWAKIKRLSVKSPATVTILGYAEGDSKSPVSQGKTTLSTSTDPVGAPVFYRDVPVMFAAAKEKGAIQPLPNSALPLIKWRLRYVGEPESRTVMENLPTCANCHSFSLDGKTLGLDMDGPRNDKGLYALVSISKNITIRNQDVIRWSSLQEEGSKSSDPSVKRFGIMSQVSPDGRYVVTSVSPPAAPHKEDSFKFVPGLADRLYSMNYRDIRFSQVFYPTRGILVWYDRKEGKLRKLPGASDPQFVQTSAFWSPDGKYLIFSRAQARDPYPPGAEPASYANDPKETQIQYDLYRIPFNEGRGGKAEPVIGASANGMSNNFPKVSPDGRWIVFVQNRNGLLMRPDSKLYILPFAGGKPRLMKCNTPLMNSWHTFSPNGRWLAFSSKGRSPFTQLMLTHIDADGNDSPAILVDNATAANRVVNIPEFVNLPADGLAKIDPQATEFYALANKAYELMEKNRMADAIPVWRDALQRDPDEALAHYALATALSGNNQEPEAAEEYRKACALDTHHANWFAHLAVSLAWNGDLDGAIDNWQKSLALDPSDASVETDLGTALFEKGQSQEGLEHLQHAVEKAPNFPDGHSHLGLDLAKLGRYDDAVEQLQKAIALEPTSAEYQFNRGYVLAQRGDFPGAVTAFQKSVQLGGGTNPRCLAALADAYDKTGRSAEAVQSAQRALDLALQEHDEKLQESLRSDLQRYERDGAAAHPR